MTVPKNVVVNFATGPFVENLSERTLIARFFCGAELVYQVTLAPRSWGRCNRRYACDWRIELSDLQGRRVGEHRYNPVGKRVLVVIDSRSLGDTLAWVPQVARFARAHPDVEVLCSQFWPQLGFDRTYPEITFVPPDSDQANIYASFWIGLYLEQNRQWRHPTDPRRIPLGRVAADILGITYCEERAVVRYVDGGRPIAPRYVCIATQSTAGAKLWHAAEGWSRVCAALRERGLLPVLIQRECVTEWDGENRSGEQSITARCRELAHCEFFIGLGSGLSWLAWAMRKPVVLISGFSQPFAEFTIDCERVINPAVCHGCWNDPAHVFAKNDWNWCPRHKGSARQFECSKSIGPNSVIRAIDRIIARLG